MPRIKTHEYPQSKDGKTCNYRGYTFYPNGTAKSPNGKLLEPLPSSRDSKTGPIVSLIEHKKDGSRRIIRVNMARAIYSMFVSNDLTRKDVVIVRNAAKPPSVKNISKLSISKWQHINSTPGRKKKFDEETCDEIACRYLFSRATVFDLSLMFGCSKQTIYRIVNNEY